MQNRTLDFVILRYFKIKLIQKANPIQGYVPGIMRLIMDIGRKCIKYLF